MKPLEIYYANHDILAKSQARKLYRRLKAAAIGILQAECKQTKGGKKVTIREMIGVLKKEL